MFIIYTAIMAGVYTIIFDQKFLIAFVKSVIAGVMFVGIYHLLTRWAAKRRGEA
ncbi:hypothetical protein GCM10023313_37430 [Mucilaginibacter defluvii]|uniref:Uncharacterized protein n=2 Tax=Mucilaginibacter defluvii TaxID=1196019 RepID=A0ABP9G8W1_9SPHI